MRHIYQLSIRRKLTRFIVHIAFLAHHRSSSKHQRNVLADLRLSIATEFARLWNEELKKTSTVWCIIIFILPSTKIQVSDCFNALDILYSIPLSESDHVIGHVEVDVMTKVMGRLNFPKSIALPGA